MIVNIALLLVCLGLVFVGDAAAQKGAARFTSGYTNLGKSCKVLRGGDGQDDASLCTGLGGYKIRIYSSASATHMLAEKPKTDVSIPVGTVSIGFNESKTAVEWRMANGKPFAIIIRLPKYGETTDADPYIGKKIGEELAVIGLDGFTETVSGSIDAKAPNANVKARELADNAYKTAAAK